MCLSYIGFLLCSAIEKSLEIPIFHLCWLLNDIIYVKLKQFVYPFDNKTFVVIVRLRRGLSLPSLLVESSVSLTRSHRPHKQCNYVPNLFLN